ncbi:MAG TPA: tetratricopeptide repeat protein, partial [Anaerolineae bacterium]|nr:tetratricopeptide repeat protein [Anaerolineae bacterium]
VRGGGRLAGAAGAAHWETGRGGGLWAAGVGGPITGRGFSLGLVDDPLYTSRAVLFLFIPLAFAVPAAPQPAAAPVATRSSRRLAWAVPALLLLALAAALFLARAPVLSALYTNLGSVRQSRAELSVYSWPRWPIQDELRRQLDLQPAIAAFQRALALAPANASAARRLGQIELSLGDYAPALAHLETAYAGDPSPTARELLAEALFVSGDGSRARALWSTLPNDAGQLATRIWWYEHLGRQDVARAMQAALP